MTENQIADVVSGWTKIPVQKLSEGEAERLRRLEGILHERVIGQDEAVTAVSKAIRRGRVGLKDPRRPIGSFLFLRTYRRGKNGAIQGAGRGHVRDVRTRMIRVDMSEYMEKHSVSRIDRLAARICGI